MYIRAETLIIYITYAKNTENADVIVPTVVKPNSEANTAKKWEEEETDAKVSLTSPFLLCSYHTNPF